MKYLMGIAGAALIVIGVVVLLDAASVTGVRSVMHQQYVTMEVILGSMLMSFGLLLAGVAGIIDAIDALRAPARDVSREPVAAPRDDLLAKVPPYARAMLAREGW
jgi:hypothetical protein